MFLDFLYIILIVFAIIKGLRKGLVLGIISFLAFIIGLAAALKLSVVVAGYLKDSAGAFNRWLPLISFMLVFIAVIFLVGLVGRLIKKTVRFAMLGWVDAIGGLLLYTAIYTIIFSVFLFYAEKLMVLQPSTIADSKIYPYIAPWGPKVMDNLGRVLPVFKDMFDQLQDFFGELAKKSAP